MPQIWCNLNWIELPVKFWWNLIWILKFNLNLNLLVEILKQKFMSVKLWFFMWNLNDVWWKFWLNRNWFCFEFGFSILSARDHFIFDPQTWFFRVFFRMLTTVFFLNFRYKKISSNYGRQLIKSGSQHLFFSNLFLCLSQLSQATLRPELLNFVQKLCSFKRLIYDLILKLRSFGGVKTDMPMYDS